MVSDNEGISAFLNGTFIAENSKFPIPIKETAPDMKLSIISRLEQKIPYHTSESDFWKKRKINEVTELGKPKGN